MFLKFNLAGFCFFPRLGLIRGYFCHFCIYLILFGILSYRSSRLPIPLSPYPQLPIAYSYLHLGQQVIELGSIHVCICIFNTLSPQSLRRICYILALLSTPKHQIAKPERTGISIDLFTDTLPTPKYYYR